MQPVNAEVNLIATQLRSSDTLLAKHDHINGGLRENTAIGDAFRILPECTLLLLLHEGLPDKENKRPDSRHKSYWPQHRQPGNQSLANISG